MFKWIRKLFVSKQKLEAEWQPVLFEIKKIMDNYMKVMTRISQREARFIIFRFNMERGLCSYIAYMCEPEIEDRLQRLLAKVVDHHRYISNPPGMYVDRESDRNKLIKALNDRVALLHHMQSVIEDGIRNRKIVYRQFNLSDYRKTG